ncbi:MAG: glycosyl hydrolase-related protein [Spirochaetaceae bacterium]|jgi:alpha-mannosidase|nr:glycosyl hydrolase-related protein [Spirochaetaceae bacterium]
MLIVKVEARIEQYMEYLEKNAYQKYAGLDFEASEDGINWKKISIPAPWGSDYKCTSFRSEIPALKADKEDEAYFLQCLPNADSLMFLDDKPYGAFNLFHKKVRLPADGKKHSLRVEAYAGHPYFGCGPFECDTEKKVVNTGHVLDAFPNTFYGGCILKRNPAVYGLYYDVRALFGLAKELDSNKGIESLRKAAILKGLSKALNTISLRVTDDALEMQAAEARKMIRPLLEAKNGSTVPTAFIVGHAHIDHAWLWPIAETERKAARTFSNMLQLAREYPEFIFQQSQPCQLDIVKNQYPSVFAEVLEAYKKGQWEPNGGMWIEADCNIPSGESLVRQFLVGTQATREMFGDYQADTLWLPDVFGYAAALPQILKGCRISYFVTSKIGWNDTTHFPYDKFIWKGIDGTGVKTVFISSNIAGYNGNVNAHELIGRWNEIQHKEVQSATISSIGQGDGGGGTLRSDLEMARRFKDLEGAPRAQWTKVSDIMRAMFEEMGADSASLPVWQGELYLELHRGTYTSQAETKRYNRKIEFALRQAEWLLSMAALSEGKAYPHEQLTGIWKRFLTNQFHDIIPGSSMGKVYEEAEAEYRALTAEIEGLISHKGTKDTKEDENLIVVNDLNWERTELIKLPNSDYREVTVPSLGWTSLETKTPAPSAPPREPVFTFSKDHLETPFYTISFNDKAEITSLFDKRQGREYAQGPLNKFVFAEDVPIFWEAWDIDKDWREHIIEDSVVLLSSEVLENNAFCFVLQNTYKVGNASRLTQKIIFYAHNPRIDFKTHSDWHEKRRLLKTEFNTSIFTNNVRCEVQYGHLVRNTTENLPQDRARFEICAHKWISLEEADYGIALLNDCKYGHDVDGGRMRLSLLRSPLAPDPHADQGEHDFTYSLYPFAGSFVESGLIHAAYELNSPLKLVQNAPAGVNAKDFQKDYSFATLDNPAVIIESLKMAEDKSAAIVLRLYESLGTKAKAALTFNTALKKAEETDMLEGNGKALGVEGRGLSLEFRPFEIKTLKLILK